jgi:hypothetical protein
MHELAEIIRDLLVAVGAMFLLLIALIVIVSRLPHYNPLKRMLVALSLRVAFTMAATLLAIPIEPIPGLDVLYDIGAPVLLILYWLSFFRGAGQALTKASGLRSFGRAIDHLLRLRRPR